jgi:hypothetical protein
MAGYSGTPLAKKLGIGANTTLTLVGAPAELASLLHGPAPGPGTSQVVVIFAARAPDMEGAFREALIDLVADGAIWCAWPKRSAGIPTDITENLLREMFLPTGLVDNKVAAIDQTWSGLRFVVRKELRPDWGRRSKGDQGPGLRA